jgi:glycosyltransferase involved in cell wall biosynthesis
MQPHPDACVIVPAYDAAATLGDVIAELHRELPGLEVIVVDDGSTDETAEVARKHSARLIRREANAGKGAALLAGLEDAHARGKRIALTVDADGQHPADEAKRVLEASDDDDALVLGVRDLERDGAPKANRFSNGISNYFLSRFVGRALRDTQCGLRRYPIAKTLALRAHGRGYDFEAEILLRAIWSGLNVIELPVRVLYPPERTTHFHSARDPWRIIRTVVAAVGEHWLRPAPDAEPAADEAR